jgi:hypothetical protein
MATNLSPQVPRVRSVRTRKLSGGVPEENDKSTEEHSISASGSKQLHFRAEIEAPIIKLKPLVSIKAESSDLEEHTKPSSEELLEEVTYNKKGDKEPAIAEKPSKILLGRKSSGVEDDDVDGTPRRGLKKHSASNILIDDNSAPEALASPRKKAQEIKSLMARVAELEKDKEDLRMRNVAIQEKLATVTSLNMTLQTQLQEAKTAPPLEEVPIVPETAAESPEAPTGKSTISRKKSLKLQVESSGNHSPKPSLASIGGKFKESLKNLGTPKKGGEFNFGGASKAKTKIDIDPLPQPIPAECIWTTIPAPPENFNIEKLKPGNEDDSEEKSKSEQELKTQFVRTKEGLEQLDSFAKRTNLSADKLVDAILKMDEAALTPENLQILLKYIPTTFAGIERYKNYLGSIDDLHIADQILHRVSKIPDVKDRIELWIFKQTFLHKFYDSVEKLRVIEQSLALVKDSEEIRQVLEAMIHVYNALNQDSALGFDLRSTMSKMLYRTSAADNDAIQTYSELVLAYLKKYHPKCLKFSTVIDVLKKAVFIDQNSFTTEVSYLQDTLESLPDVCANFDLAGDDDRFKDVMREFYIERKPLMLALNRRTQHATKETERLSKVYCDKTASTNWERLFQAVIMMSDFLAKAAMQKKDGPSLQVEKPSFANRRKSRVASRISDAASMFENKDNLPSPVRKSESPGKKSRSHARAASVGQGLEAFKE